MYKFDTPWTYHLKRVLDLNGGTSSFRHVSWAAEFVTAYVAAISKLEETLVKETGFAIGLQVK